MRGGLVLPKGVLARGVLAKGVLARGVLVGGVLQLLVGCGSSSAPEVEGLREITITSPNRLVELDLKTSGEQLFQAIGHYTDGRLADLSREVTWSSSNARLGSFVGSKLQIPAFTQTTAEVTMVSATLGEVSARAQLTVVVYRKSGAQQDFFFILPYKGEGSRQSKDLTFHTDVRNLDVFFDMDCTRSMGEEIVNLQQGLKTVVVPGIQAQSSGAQFGAGSFMDFPLNPYGMSPNDQPFRLMQAITTDVSAVQEAVNKFAHGETPIGQGGDIPEALLESVYQIATGEGLDGPQPTYVPPNHSGVGGVGFRKGSMPVIVTITDAYSHAPSETSSCLLDSADYQGVVGDVAHDRAHTKTSLQKICARVVGVASMPTYGVECTGLSDLEDLATASGARVSPQAWDVTTRPAGCAATDCCTDIDGKGRAPDGDGLCPLVFKVDAQGGGLSDAVVTGMKMLARSGSFDVTVQLVGESMDLAGVSLPSGKSSADLIKQIRPAAFVKPPAPPTVPDPLKSESGFQGVSPGTTVTFSVQAYNDTVEDSSKARLFRAVIKVLAGTCTDLDQREVFVLVPPQSLIE